MNLVNNTIVSALTCSAGIAGRFNYRWKGSLGAFAGGDCKKKA